MLGGFTLFLTFFIGIRFLVKPDTTKKNQAAHGEKPDWRGIIISLFFGLTIGFGTGFVGTGGGMMMLVVFTAFLGMELKTAVETSTFIMTFTSIVHISFTYRLIQLYFFMNPSIISKGGDANVLLLRGT